MICPYCKKQFVQRVKNQKYCTTDCAKKAAQKRIEKYKAKRG